jgi:uncharacterized protein
MLLKGQKEMKPWFDRMSSFLPNREVLAAHAWLAPIANRVLSPELWRFQHESVARGVAIGIFWAFVIPAGQMLAAAAHCTLWRANIPVAAAMTMVTNPLTIGFWLWFAYKFGGVLLGESVAVDAVQTSSIGSWFATYGWPTVLGMGVFAVGGAVMGYLLVKLAWRLRVSVKRAARQNKGK